MGVGFGYLLALVHIQGQFQFHGFPKGRHAIRSWQVCSLVTSFCYSSSSFILLRFLFFPFFLPGRFCCCVAAVVAAMERFAGEALRPPPRPRAPPTRFFSRPPPPTSSPPPAPRPPLQVCSLVTLALPTSLKNKASDWKEDRCKYSQYRHVRSHFKGIPKKRLHIQSSGCWKSTSNSRTVLTRACFLWAPFCRVWT